MSSTGIRDEIDALTTFLCRRDPTNFRRLSEETIEIGGAREAIILASAVRDSFFLIEDGQDGLREYPVDLKREFA